MAITNEYVPRPAAVQSSHAGVDIKFDPQQMADVRKMLWGIRGGVNKVLVLAVNRVVVGGRTDFTKETTKILNAKVSYVRKRISISKASLSSSKLSARLYSSGTPMPLIDFTGTRQNKTGTSVQVYRTLPRKTIKHAFMLNTVTVGGSKYHNVYERIRKDGKRVARLPIRVLRGPRMQDVMAKPEVIKPTLVKIGVRLRDRLDHETQRLLDRQR